MLHATAQQDSIPSLPARKLLFFPVVARSVETGWMFGAVASSTFRISKRDTASRTSNIQGLALYSTKKQLVSVINGTIYFPGEKYILNHRLSYSHFPDKFWGIGKHAPDSAEEPYQFKQFYLFLHAMRQVGRSWFIGGVYELQQVMDIHYKKDGLFDKQQVPGRERYLISGIGASITYDTRNNAFAPDKGSFLELTAKYYMPATGSDFTYSNIIQDLRKYIPVGKKNVLALQLYNFMNIGKEIPLRSLGVLGGDNCMRGYYSGRFRDKQMIALQTEWRMPVYKRWGIVAFGSTGDVAEKVMDYDLASLKYAYGGGIRFALNQKERLNLRLDYGFTSNKGQGLYLQLAEAF
jgi:outer membrane protein assembly factor BamA